MLTDDIKAMGASGAGPVRVAEVQAMQRGIASLKQSPATVRYLLEELYRTHNDNIALRSWPSSMRLIRGGRVIWIKGGMRSETNFMRIIRFS